jgi:hypothetical protein
MERGLHGDKEDGSATGYRCILKSAYLLFGELEIYIPSKLDGVAAAAVKAILGS